LWDFEILLGAFVAMGYTKWYNSCHGKKTCGK